MTSSIDLIISFEARQDIYDVQQYTLETWGDEQVDEYEGILDTVFKRIRSFPIWGVNATMVSASTPYGMYRYDADMVTILRVMHPRRLR